MAVVIVTDGDFCHCVGIYTEIIKIKYSAGGMIKI